MASPQLVLLVFNLLLLLFMQGDGRNITTFNLATSFTPLDNTFLVSPNHTFALGFLQKPPTPSGSSQYNLNIFYFQSPQKTVVWTAYRGSLLSLNASLLLTREGDLVLTDGSATPVWNTSTSGRGVASAHLTDGGNLILLDQQSSSVWESWGSPTDTLLPGQSIYFTNTNVVASNGRYFLATQSDGEVVMYFNGATTQQPITSIAYYSTGKSNQSTELYFDFSGELLLRRNGSTPTTLLRDSLTGQQPLLRRIVMGNDGLLTLFTSWDDGKSWSSAAQLPSGDSACSIIGVCGHYGICNNSNCSCPQGFAFVNDADWAEGCHPTQPMDCDVGTNMLELLGVGYPRWPDFSYYNSSISVQDCLQQCKDTCFCAAAVHDGQNCRLKLLGQIIGGELQPNSVTYLKISAYANDTSIVRQPPPTPPASSTGGDHRRIISDRAAIAFGIPLAFAAIVGLLNLGWFYKTRREARKEDLDDHVEAGEGDEPDGRPLLDGPVHYSYKELRAATNGFKEVVGRGGFGAVYKGVLAGGIPVAVKKLEARSFGEKQFKAEVRTIGSLHHVNLVRLRGYCVRGKDRLLVYDFMNKGSLDKHLFAKEAVVEGNAGSSKPPQLLEWKKRFNIVLGTARAIKYLHEECEPGIVHCDIKPENILLDEEFCAKVSDFGMAQLLGGDFTGSITTVRGTVGYMAPEWTSSTRISNKADVYSFGMVLLELLSGRKAIDLSVEDACKVELAPWAYTEFSKNHKACVLVDDDGLFPAMHVDEAEFLRTADTSFWCIQKDPFLRPSMGIALQMLEGLLPIPPPPCPF